MQTGPAADYRLHVSTHQMMFKSGYGHLSACGSVLMSHYHWVVKSQPEHCHDVLMSQVSRINMPDSRADAMAIRAIIGRGRENVSSTLRQYLWRYAPSACK